MGCNCRQYICVPAPQTCCTPETETVLYTFENANVVGLGFFDNESSQLVQFRGLVSDSDALTLTLDAANKVIRIDFDGDLLINDIPDASEAQRGMLEVATQAEANAGAVDNKIMTPLKVATMQATETQIGVLRIATQAEVTTGTNDTEAITPLKLATFSGAQNTTRTFADAVARAAAVPTFNGQLGAQLDTDALIMATGTVAGSFTPNIVIGGTLTVSGIGLFADGNVTTPGIAFSGDTDVGIYRLGANELGIAASGSNIARFAFGEIHLNAITYGVDGGVSTPTFGFASSAETGMYLPNSDEIGFTCGGVNSFTITSTYVSLSPGIAFLVDNTITPGTGDQVINKVAGSVNFAAAATALVVTNDLVTTNSMVFCQVATDDTTMKTVSVTQTAGAFTITANAAASGTTRVNFFVVN